MNKIQTLLNQVKTIKDSYDLVAKTTGENFNVFQILGMERSEVKTHSRFLAELLNRKGSHGQGEVFLRLFVAYLKSEYEYADDEENKVFNTLKNFEFDCEKATTVVEKYIGVKTSTSGGFIDIHIEANNRYIIIENKIDAGEQENQLLRYCNYVSEKDNLVFFLTLDGKVSVTKDVSQLVIPISYEKDIIKWLELCKKEAVNLPILREAIGQYINLIKKLTGQSIYQEMDKEIINLVLSNPDNFNSFTKLNQIKDKVKREVYQNHMIPFLEKIAEERNYEFKGNSGFVNGHKWNYVYFRNKRATNLNLRVSFGFESKNYGSPIIGLNYQDNSKKFPVYDKIQNDVKEKFGSKFHSTGNFLGSVYYKWDNWGYLNKLEKFLYDDFKNELKETILFFMDLIEKNSRP